jgi:MFS family permease
MPDKEHKKMDRNIFYLGMTSFFNDWSSEMIFPLLPAFMADVLGIPKTLIGLIDGIAESAASILKVFSGYISDRLGKRKALAVAGYGFSTVVKPFLALATGWFLVLFVRVADRIGKGIRTAPRDALIAASSHKENRGRSFGFHRAMDTFGALVGTVCAYFLLKYLPVVNGTGAYRTIFVLTAIPAFIGVLFLIFGTKDKKDVLPGNKPKLSWRALPKQLKILIIATFIFGIGNYTFTFFLLRVHDMGIPDAVVPLVYLVYNVTYFLGSYPSGVISDKVGKKRMLAVGFSLYILTALLFAFLNAPIWAWLIMGVYGLHMAVTDATARASVSDLADPEIRGTALGVYHTSVGVSQLPAGLLAGFLWDKTSPQTVFLVAAIISALALAILVCTPEKKRSAKLNLIN